MKKLSLYAFMVLMFCNVSFADNLKIVDGDTTPSKEDFTDLGTVTVGKSSSSTFSIKNVGTANLVLSAVTATNGFVISSIAPPTTLQPTAPNNVATFLVTFTGAAVGV